MTLGLAAPLPGEAPFQAVFRFACLFIPPYVTPLAIEVDGSRRTAALGPLAAFLLVGERDARAASHLCAGIGLVALALVVGLHLSGGRARLRADG